MDANPEHFRKLRIEVKQLVNAGIWGMYALKPSAEHPYLLLQAERRWCGLNLDGEVQASGVWMSHFNAIADQIDSAIHFPGIPNPYVKYLEPK